MECTALIACPVSFLTIQQFLTSDLSMFGSKTIIKPVPPLLSLTYIVSINVTLKQNGPKFNLDSPQKIQSI